MRVLVDRGVVTQIEGSASMPTVALPSMRPSPAAETAPPLYAATVPAPVPATEPRRLGIGFAVVAALLCGVLGLVVTPVLLGPAAIVGGFAGEHLGRSGTRKLGPAAILAVTVAGLVAAIVLL